MRKTASEIADIVLVKTGVSKELVRKVLRRMYASGDELAAGKLQPSSIESLGYEAPRAISRAAGLPAPVLAPKSGAQWQQVLNRGGSEMGGPELTQMLRDSHKQTPEGMQKLYDVFKDVIRK